MSIKVRYLFQCLKKTISVQRESKFSKNNNEELLPLIKLKEKNSILATAAHRAIKASAFGKRENKK